MRQLNTSDITISSIYYNYINIKSKSDPEAIERVYESIDVEFYLFGIVKCEVTWYAVLRTEDAIKDQIVELFKDKLNPNGIQFT